ncbi:MAG: hypothetical protein FWC94_02765 [Bacteroidales bacterium]|nr:hypothetical protein [Bacteroidales bacterium]
MRKLENIENFVAFVNSVHKQRTGNVEAFARRLSVSPATIYRMIEELELYGVEIKYCRTRKSYRFCGDKVINIYLSIDDSLTEVTKEEMKQVNGGYKVSSTFFSTFCHFLKIEKVKLYLCGRKYFTARDVKCYRKNKQIINQQKLKIMKMFDLEAYGVVEASKQEVLETNGGISIGEAFFWAYALRRAREFDARQSSSESFAGDVVSGQFGPPSMPA